MLHRLLWLATMGVAGLALLPVDAGAAGATHLIPACASLQAAHRLSRSGDFVVPASAAILRPLHLRCVRADGVFLVYLVLSNTSGANTSSYTAGGASPGTTVTTRYTAIRFDPDPISVFPLIFEVNVADETFSTSTGQLCHASTAVPCPDGQSVTSMPYAVAMDCMGPGSATGTANVDLSGTPFTVLNTFQAGGFMPGGSTTFTSPGSVDLTGGGFCGWNASGPMDNPYNTNPLGDANGGWDLDLLIEF